MYIRDRGDGDPTAELEEIERRGNELTEFIPVERDAQQRAVRDEDDGGDDRQEISVGTRADAAAEVDD